jgi:hypothetical protein
MNRDMQAALRKMYPPVTFNAGAVIRNLTMLFVINTVVFFSVIAILQIGVLASPDFARGLYSYLSRPLSVLIIRVEY